MCLWPKQRLSREVWTSRCKYWKSARADSKEAHEMKLIIYSRFVLDKGRTMPANCCAAQARW